MYILAAILMFGILIAVHELGHFLAAKVCGVRVNEFSIGMGPALFHRTRGETEYALRLFPIGGYCAMEGEDEDSEDVHALNRQGFWRKLFIFSAGAVMNFLIGIVILLILYSGVSAFYTPVITGLAPEFTHGGESGLQVGDRIYAVDGERIYLYNDLSMFFPRGNGTDFDLVVERDGQRVTLEDFPLTRGEYSSFDGGKYTGYGLYFGTEAATPLLKLQYTWYNAVDFVRIIRYSLQELLTGGATMADLSGPVGIVSTISQVGEDSATTADAVNNILYFAALIAVNLAVMNLLPLPALDGGKIFFLVLDAATMAVLHKRIPDKYQNAIHTAGFVLLMGLMLVVTFRDVVKLFQ
ncbi:MAG: site-2 protease family protein [Oscillospiraceae bacterium]